MPEKTGDPDGPRLSFHPTPQMKENRHSSSSPALGFPVTESEKLITRGRVSWLGVGEVGAGAFSLKANMKNTGKKNDNFSILVTKGLSKTKTES